MQKIFSLLYRIKVKFYNLYVRFFLKSIGRGGSISYPCTIYKPELVELGDAVFIREHAWLNAARADGSRTVLKMGSNIYIGRFCHINASQGVTLEDDVLIADRVYISDFDHDFSDPSIPVIKQGIFSKGPVTLRSGCWIGAGAVILSGVTVGKNAVVGANSVVNRNVPDYAVVAGSPAKVIKVRNPG